MTRFSAHRHPARDAAARSVFERRLRRGRSDGSLQASRSPAISAISRRPRRSGVLHPGEAKNTYGTGCFLLLNTGDKSRSVQARPAHHRRVSSSATRPRCTRWKDRSPSLARWSNGCATTSMIKASPRSKPSRARSTTTAAFIRAGVLGPVRAVLESMPAVSSRSDALRQPRPHRARRTRSDGLPEPRSARSDAQRFRRRPRVAQGRRRHGRQRSADAVPGRHAQRAGGAPEGARNNRARRGICGGAGRRGCGRRSRTCGRTGSRTSAGNRRWHSAKRDEYYKYWKRAVTRTFDWFDAE